MDAAGKGLDKAGDKVGDCPYLISIMPIHENDKRRFFVVTVGRTGSSLLASIMADAGADFGVQGEDNWDPAGGAYEHPSLVPVVQHFGRMNEIGFRRPYGIFARLRWTTARHRAKLGLRALLSQARFFKGEVDHLVHWSARLGYSPTVIVSYRCFGEVLRSLGHLHPQPPNYHADRYDTVLRNGLALASIYGGCVIDYRELVEPGETAWAGGLAQATGIGEDNLLAARASRVKTLEGGDREAPEPFQSCQETYATLRRQNGIFLPPSTATIRAMKKNAGD